MNDTKKRLTAGGTLPRCQGLLNSGEQCRYSGNEHVNGNAYCGIHIEEAKERAERHARFVEWYAQRKARQAA